MTKRKAERTYSERDLEGTRWGWYKEGMRRALEVAEGELKMARSYYEGQSEAGEVGKETRAGGVLEGIKAVVTALRRELGENGGAE